MHGSRGRYLAAIGGALALAGVQAFAFGRGFPEYQFGRMRFDDYCFWGTVLTAVGAGLFIAGVFDWFTPADPGPDAPRRSPLAAAVLVTGLVVGVCAAAGLGGYRGGPTGAAPEDAAKQVLELFRQQQDAMKSMRR